MTDNNENHENQNLNENAPEIKNENSNKKNRKSPYFHNIKNKFVSGCKKIWSWLKGYLQIALDWITGKRGTRADRWAMAVCLLMSVTVWLYVMSTNDTGFEKQLSGVSVDVEGNAALGAVNMSIINGYDNNVNITLKGKRGDIGKLTAEDLHLYIDVSQIKEAGRYNLPVMVDLPKNSTLISIEPSQVPVNVDVNASIPVEVRVKLDYILDSSYTLSTPVPNPRNVIISGPASVLNTVDYAAVSFDAGVIDKSLTLVGSLALYDEYGMIVSNPYVKCNVSEVSVTVLVTATKEVPLKINFPSGVMSSNYNVTIKPSKIKITGDPTVLKDINEIYVYDFEELEIGVSKTIQKQMSDFNLPYGVSVTDPNQGVSITVERKPG